MGAKKTAEPLNQRMRMVKDVPVILLPNAVLFPRTLLPVQITEKHTIHLVLDALRTDKAVGVVLRRRGNPLEKGLPAAPVGCIGQIESYEKMPMDRLNILLRGTVRFALIETVQMRPFLRAKVQPLHDEDFALTTAEKMRLFRHFKGRVEAYLEQILDIGLQPFLHSLEATCLESLIHQTVTYLDIGVNDKQRLLELPSLLIRYQFVKNEIEERLAALSCAENDNRLIIDPILN